MNVWQVIAIVVAVILVVGFMLWWGRRNKAQEDKPKPK